MHRFKDYKINSRDIDIINKLFCLLRKLKVKGKSPCSG